jgi:AbrB family looped-hinge helix DNA binding protein
MTEVRTHVDNNGRILIPAQIRKAFDIKAGDVFVMRVIDGEIKMISLKKALEDAQALVKRYVPKEVLMVDELIKQRRAEYLKEEGKL